MHRDALPSFHAIRLAQWYTVLLLLITSNTNSAPSSVQTSRIPAAAHNPSIPRWLPYLVVAINQDIYSNRDFNHLYQKPLASTQVKNISRSKQELSHNGH